jgi:amidophosphoribosyltransferase
LGYLSLAGLGRAIKTAEAANGVSVSNEEALSFLNQEFCYGCMETQGWPFDPIEGAKHGAQHATFFPRSIVEIVQAQSTVPVRKRMGST